MSKGLLIFILCFVFNIISVEPTPKLPLLPWPSLITSIPRCPAVPALEDVKAAIKDLTLRPRTPDLKLLDRTAFESKDEQDCENNVVELCAEEINGEESRNELVEEFNGEEINSEKNEDYKKQNDNNKEAEIVEESNLSKPVDQRDDRSKEKFEKTEVENINNDKNKNFINPLPTFIPIFRKRKPKRPRIYTQNINTPSEQKQTNVNSTVIQEPEEKQDLVVQYVQNADSKPVLNIFGPKNAIENSNIRIIPLNLMNGNVLTVNKFPSESITNSQPLDKLNVFNVVPQTTVLPSTVLSKPLNSLPENAVHMNTNLENTVPKQAIPIKTVTADTVPINMIPASSISLNTVPENSASLSIFSTNNFPTNNIPLNIIPSNLLHVSKVPENTIQINSFPVESVTSNAFPINAVPASNFPVNTFSESANSLNTKSLGSFPVNEVIMNTIPTNKIPAGTIPIKVVPENSNPKPKSPFPITTFPAHPVSINVIPASNAAPRSSITSNALPTITNRVPSIASTRIVEPSNTVPSETIPLNCNPSLRNPSNMLPVKSGSNECQSRPDKADLVIFKPENVTLVNMYGDYLKKVTMTVLVPMYVSKVDV